MFPGPPEAPITPVMKTFNTNPKLYTDPVGWELVYDVITTLPSLSKHASDGEEKERRVGSAGALVPKVEDKLVVRPPTNRVTLAVALWRKASKQGECE